ncbi:MAG: hypothetical protein HUJ51_06595 [Eggerthellaceae bacterium]|nr:hypothetical protein [Eggerthellaceae bacterium]
MRNNPSCGPLSAGEGGGGGTDDYNALNNKPRINNITLSDNKTGDDLGLLDKVETETTYNQVYAKTPDGSQGMYSMGTEVASGLIVKRKGNKQISVEETPQDDSDAASKKYVDLAAETVKQNHTDISGELAILTKPNNTSTSGKYQAYFNTGVTVNPETQTISAKSFIEDGQSLRDKYVNLDKVKELFYPIGVVVMGDNLSSESTVKSIYGGTTWTRVTGALYGDGVKTVDEQLPNIKFIIEAGDDKAYEPLTSMVIANGYNVKSYKTGWCKRPSSTVWGNENPRPIAVEFNARETMGNTVFTDNGHVLSAGTSTYAWKRTE